MVFVGSMLRLSYKRLCRVSAGLCFGAAVLSRAALVHADGAAAAKRDPMADATKPVGSDNGAAADVLFQEGKSLMAVDKIREACPKFSASYKLERKLGTLLNWADCLEKDAKFGSAYERFGEAVDWAKARSDDRGDYAKRRRDALAPRVPKLRLAVTRGAEKLLVFRDGVVVSEETFGLSVPVDPGTIEIEVRRDDELLDKRTAKIEEGRELEVPLDLAAISRAHPPRRELKPVSKAQRTAGFVIGSVGLAGLVTFGILEGAAYGQKAKADAPGGCKNGFCTPSGFKLNRKAGNLAEAGQWVGVASGAVLAVGVTLLLTAPRSVSAKEAPHVGFAPFIAPGVYGFSLGGDL